MNKVHVREVQVHALMGRVTPVQRIVYLAPKTVSASLVNVVTMVHVKYPARAEMVYVTHNRKTALLAHRIVHARRVNFAQQERVSYRVHVEMGSVKRHKKKTA